MHQQALGCPVKHPVRGSDWQVIDGKLVGKNILPRNSTVLFNKKKSLNVSTRFLILVLLLVQLQIMYWPENELSKWVKNLKKTASVSWQGLWKYCKSCNPILAEIITVQALAHVSSGFALVKFIKITWFKFSTVTF